MQDSNTSLHYASSHGHTELCELLIGTKADVGAKDEVLGVKPPTDVGTTSVPTDVGTMRTEPGQTCHSMTMMWACERFGGRS